MCSNYPDDVRQYDYDPRSPFYDDSQDEPEVELQCDCGALLENEDEVFSEVCDECFAESELEDVPHRPIH